MITYQSPPNIKMIVIFTVKNPDIDDHLKKGSALSRLNFRIICNVETRHALSLHKY
ncbi:hypothetical protein MTBBW1_1130007 [Desulfamplus magnetovallimortis]|uniref:Uncharacterized protein n=1 Tax=Desulfamplus magnetovallimortis TaxID=1246637 RepID=A0A1W1H5Q5_9BACT|nr:hypothetical protein MTBBW1_1130007 [Desulfamplus magnetovallimortis]